MNKSVWMIITLYVMLTGAVIGILGAAHVVDEKNFWMLAVATAVVLYSCFKYFVHYSPAFYTIIYLWKTKELKPVFDKYSEKWHMTSKDQMLFKLPNPKNGKSVYLRFALEMDRPSSLCTDVSRYEYDLTHLYKFSMWEEIVLMLYILTLGSDRIRKARDEYIKESVST